jgi:hypothetical protein
MTTLLRSLWGEDVIALSPEGLELIWRAGPITQRYAFERAGIRRIRVRPRDKYLVVDSATKGTQTLTNFGTPEERTDAADWLVRSLSLPDEASLAAAAMPPSAWSIFEDADGVRLSKVTPRARFVRSAILWLLAALFGTAMFAFRGAGAGPGVPGLAITALFVLFAALSTWSRREWIVRRGEIAYRWSVPGWASARTFVNGRLDVTHHTDSDNDTHYDLVVIDGVRRKTIHSQMHDAAEVVDLGHWLAARSGFPLALSDVIRQGVGPAAAR